MARYIKSKPGAASRKRTSYRLKETRVKKSYKRGLQRIELTKKFISVSKGLNGRVSRINTELERVVLGPVLSQEKSAQLRKRIMEIHSDLKYLFGQIASNQGILGEEECTRLKSKLDKTRLATFNRLANKFFERYSK